MAKMTRIKPPATPGPASGTVKNKGKSGYARDIMPDRVTSEEATGTATPVASESGVQEGRVPAARRKTGHYGAVSAEEADRLLRARAAGEAPRIENGLDSPGIDKFEQPRSQYDDKRMEVGDSSEEVPGGGKPDLNDLASLLLENLKAAAIKGNKSEPVDIVGVTESGVVERKQPVKDPRLEYLDSRARIQMQVKGAGMFTVPAIAVIPAVYGIVILLPAGDSDATFTPQPGSEVRVIFKEKTYDCFFPGVCGLIEPLGIMVMAMVDQGAKETEE